MAKGKYQEWLNAEKLILIEGWARDGLTEEQIAHNMGINAKTLWKWKNTYDPICNALKSGKEVVDRQVENALLKRALGYRYREITQELVVDKDTGKPKLTVTKVVEKEVVPDTTAQIFWLKNRKQEDWRDKRIVNDIENSKNEKILQDMQTIADILQHPAQNRDISDYEDTSNE